MFKRFLVTFVLFFFLLLGGCFYYVNPGAVPVDFSRQTSFNFDFQVYRPEFYWFQLLFDVSRLSESERLRFRKLLERERRSDGFMTGAIGVPMSLAIFSVCNGGPEQLVMTKDFYPVLTGWGRGELIVNIGSKELLPGRYRAKLESSNTVSEFGAVPTAFSIGVSAKTNYPQSDSMPTTGKCQ